MMMPNPSKLTGTEAESVFSDLLFEKALLVERRLNYKLTENQLQALHTAYNLGMDKKGAAEMLRSLRTEHPLVLEYIADIERVRYMYDQFKAQQPKKPPIRFGSFVSFTHVIVRGAAHAGADVPLYMFWDLTNAPVDKKKTGLLIGYRTLHSRFLFNNKTHEKDRNIRVAKVCRSAASNPIYVAVQGMKKL